MSKHIKTQQPYVGFARHILLEDKLEPGFPAPYEILDNQGQAYVLKSSDSEVKTCPHEGKWVPPELFRIATFPFVRKEDLFYCPGIEEDTKKKAREAIAKQEDGRLLTLLEEAVSDYAKNPDQ